MIDHLGKSEDGWMIGMIGVLSFDLDGMYESLPGATILEIISALRRKILEHITLSFKERATMRWRLGVSPLPDLTGAWGEQPKKGGQALIVVGQWTYQPQYSKPTPRNFLKAAIP